MFCDKVTKALYSNYSDPVGLADPQGKAAITKLLAAGFDELKSKIGLDIPSTQSLQSYMPSIFPDFEEVEKELGPLEFPPRTSPYSY